LLYKNLNIWNGVGEDIFFGDIFVDKDIFGIGRSKQSSSKDFSGCFAIPGLIDSHIHLCLDPYERNPLKQEVDEEKLKAAMISRAELIVKAGITTVRDLGGGKHLELLVRDLIKEKKLTGPRLICAGQPITSRGGHCHFWGGEAESIEEAIKVMNRQAMAAVDLIKIMVTGGSMTPKSKPINSQFDLDFLTKVVGEAKKLNYPVAAHCHGSDGILKAAEAGVSTIEHCSWVGESGWGRGFDMKTATLISKKEIWVSPTVNSGWKRYLESNYLEILRNNFKKMKEVGVRFIASTDAGIPNIFHTDLPLAMPVFSEIAGLTNTETLRAATSDAARAIGLSGVTGSIESGCSADFVIYDENPLADLNVLKAPKLVVVRGQEVSVD
tara:strand:+ start:122 stop:1267 length:1146 start_codon:yes stop_codon:yes gene_type:complete